ncbi:hypothetical protein [Ruegeria marina]|uniref:hypothetical protein n=1 Tax=Ruegeria marina TaxID=639004 RepID=UPI00115F877A|nr:hypothetical protein [Ruegeria marina]
MTQRLLADTRSRDGLRDAVADHRTPQDRGASQPLDLIAQARARTAALLARPAPGHVPPEFDASIRRDYPIRLA